MKSRTHKKQTNETNSMDIHQSRDFVLDQAKRNIEFVLKSQANVGQAKQVNASLSAIVAIERSMVMYQALERMRKGGGNEDVQGLPEH
jgi:hypothetical protein